MLLNELFHNTSYDYSLFSDEARAELESRIFTKSVRGVDVPYIVCSIRQKEIKLTPEEAVRQLFVHKLLNEYMYPASRIELETAIHFGREVKRADITIADKDRPTVNDTIIDTASLPLKCLGGTNGIVTIKKSIDPGSEAYCDDGIPFVRVSDVSKYGITETGVYLNPKDLGALSSLFPKKDAILLSKDGSIGIAYKLESDMKIVTSGALLHLYVKKPHEVLPDYLTLVLNSPIVKLQAERDSNGAIIQHWKPSDIEKVVIPIPDIALQKRLAGMVQKSFNMRAVATQYADYAKHAVEIAIEHGEDAAIAWLNNTSLQLEAE